MKQITASLTIKALHETFCRFGMPESIKTDNGPQFISSELLEFCNKFGIEHRRTTPYWPQANGEVERINRSIGKRLKISQETADSDWKWELRNFVLMHNSTPHSTTGVAPSSLMFGRKLKDKLPGLMLKGNTVLEEVQDRDHVKKMKEAEYADERRMAKVDDLAVGDTVVLKRVQKDNKLSTTFDSEEYKVIGRRGSDCTLQSTQSGRTVHRNVAHVKKLVTAADDRSEQQRSLSCGEPRRNEATVNSETDESRSGDTNVEIHGAGNTPWIATPGSDNKKLRPRRESKKPLYLKDFEVRHVE